MVQIQEEQELSEINVTPFIDIMLVLLIIFMVVAPLITSSIKIELPKTSTQEEQDDKKPLILSINNEEIAVNEEKTTLQGVASLLDEKTKGDKDSIVYFMVDKSVPYEKLMEVINVTKGNGYNKIALAQEAKE